MMSEDFKVQAASLLENSSNITDFLEKAIF